MPFLQTTLLQLPLSAYPTLACVMGPLNALVMMMRGFVRLDLKIQQYRLQLVSAMLAKGEVFSH